MNKLILYLSKDIIMGFLYAILTAMFISGFLYIGKSTEAYGLYTSQGASIEPYCLNCLGFYINIEPNINNLIIYNIKFNDADFLTVHPLLYKTEDKYYACVNPYKNSCLDIDEVNKKDYRGRAIFELPLEITEDFMLACLKELDGTKQENKIKYCLDWREDYFKFKDGI